MGCARWKGARLKDVLDKAGIKKEAVEPDVGADLQPCGLSPQPRPVGHDRSDVRLAMRPTIFIVFAGRDTGGAPMRTPLRASKQSGKSVPFLAFGIRGIPGSTAC